MSSAPVEAYSTAPGGPIRFTHSPAPSNLEPLEPLAVVLHREKFDDSKKFAFKQLKACAVFVTGTAGFVPKTFGDNKGVWPLRFGPTQSWPDTISPPLMSASSVHMHMVLFRVWFTSVAHARQFVGDIPEFLAGRVEPLLGSWVDFQGNREVGEFDRLSVFRENLFRFAHQQELVVRSDMQMSRYVLHLSEVAAKTHAKNRYR
jgi:hypothetical protein